MMSLRVGGRSPIKRHELRDVDAQVADPLDVDDRVQQRRDQPQVARDRRLTREQAEDALVDSR